MPVRVVQKSPVKLTVVSPGLKQVNVNSAKGAPGKSAYESAVTSGFVGTEQEWIDSITNTSNLPTHINSPTPHPAYDDLPDFNLLFENGLI